MYEVIETISGIHLILEYAPGGELFARLTSEKGPYKEFEAKIVFAQIASAIQYMVIYYYRKISSILDIKIYSRDILKCSSLEIIIQFNYTA